MAKVTRVNALNGCLKKHNIDPDTAEKIRIDSATYLGSKANWNIKTSAMQAVQDHLDAITTEHQTLQKSIAKHRSITAKLATRKSLPAATDEQRTAAETSRAALAKTIPKMLTTEHAPALAAHAEIEKPVFLHDVDQAAAAVGGEIHPDAPRSAMKDTAGIKKKLDEKGRISDALRTTISHDNPNDVDVASGVIASMAKQGYEVALDKNGQPDITNLYDDPSSAYKHVAIKFKKAGVDPLIKEVLIVTNAMWDARMSAGHAAYKMTRIIDQAETEGKIVEAGVISLNKLLKARSDKLYAEAASVDARALANALSSGPLAPATINATQAFRSTLPSAIKDLREILKSASAPISAIFRHLLSISADSSGLKTFDSLIGEPPSATQGKTTIAENISETQGKKPSVGGNNETALRDTSVADKVAEERDVDLLRAHYQKVGREVPVEVVTPNEKEAAAIEIARLLGINTPISILKTSEANGMFFDTTRQGGGPRIYLESGNINPVIAILAHESTHGWFKNVKNEDGTSAYLDLIDAILPFMDAKQYNKTRALVEKAYGKKKGTFDNEAGLAIVMEEIVGDTVATRWNDAGFWKMMSNVFPELAQKFHDLLGKLLGQKSYLENNKMWTDVKAVHDLVDKFLVEAAKPNILDMDAAPGARITQDYENLSGMSPEDMLKLSPAWHGTPHDFEKFMLSAMGTGEGAQAYGWGLYFAESRDVAEWYRDKLATGRVTVNGGEINYNYDNSGYQYALGKLFDGDYKNISEAITDLSEKAEATNYSADKRDLGRAVEQLKKLQKIGAEYTQNKKLYKVELAPSAEDYLLWDKPLSEQSEKVKTALKDDKSWEFTASLKGKSGDNGRFVYKDISDRMGGDKSASEYLHSLGIRGIKYADGSTRSKEDQNFNYVIFDENDVDIQLKLSPKEYKQVLRSKFLWMKKKLELTGSSKAVNEAVQKQLDEYIDKMGDGYHAFIEQALNNKENYPGMQVTGMVKNTDPTYKLTVDLVGACVRMLRAMSVHKFVRENGGKKMSSFQMRALEVELNKQGFALTCAYCYAFTRRTHAIKKLEQMKSDLQSGVMPKDQKKSARKGAETEARTVDRELWGAALKEAEAKPGWAEDYDQLPDMLQIKTPSDLKSLDKVSPEAAAFAKKYPAIHALKQRETDAGNMKMVTGNIAIAGQILNLSNEMVADLDQWGGLRWQSSIDFVPMMTFDYINGIVEMAMREVSGHVYTKEIDLALLVANSGFKVNLSAAPLVRNGKIVWEGTGENRRPKLDTSIGSMSWKEIEQAMAAGPDHIGVMMLGINDEILDWAATSGSKWAPYVIPWHSSRMPAAISGVFKKVIGAQDYVDPHEGVRTYDSKEDVPERFQPIAVEQMTKGAAEIEEGTEETDTKAKKVATKNGKWIIDYTRLGEIDSQYEKLAKAFDSQLTDQTKIIKGLTLNSVNIPTGLIIDQTVGVDDVVATEAYFRLLDELHLDPLFELYRAEFEKRTGEHHGERYWVLKKHYARTDTPLLPPKPELLNYDHAKKLEQEYSESPLGKHLVSGKGGIFDAYMNVPLTPKQKKDVLNAMKVIAENPSDPMGAVLADIGPLQSYKGRESKTWPSNLEGTRAFSAIHDRQARIEIDDSEAKALPFKTDGYRRNDSQQWITVPKEGKPTVTDVSVFTAGNGEISATATVTRPDGSASEYSYRFPKDYELWDAGRKAYMKVDEAYAKDYAAEESLMRDKKQMSAFAKKSLWSGIKLGQILDHPELYDAYPRLADIPVMFVTQSVLGAHNSGAFGEDHIQLLSSSLQSEKGKKKLSWHQTKTLLHEIQHYIQHQENYARGTNTESAGGRLGYWLTAGEFEARDVANRSDLTAERRGAIGYGAMTEDEDTRGKRLSVRGTSMTPQIMDAAEIPGPRFSIATKDEIPPENKQKIGYRAFRLKNGRLYPAMIGDRPVPFGHWLIAEYGPPHEYEKGGVKTTISDFSEIPEDADALWVKNAQGGGSLAYRPGFHLGEVPSAAQFLVEGKSKWPSDMVFVEAKYDARNNYDADPLFADHAAGNKIKKNKIRSLPEDGFYRYRTNPDPSSMPWVITDKTVNVRVLSDEEVRGLVDQWNSDNPNAVEKAVFVPRADRTEFTPADAQRVTEEALALGANPDGVRVNRKSGALHETVPKARVPGKGYDLVGGKVVLRDEGPKLSAKYPERNADETDKQYAKRVIDKMPAPKSLPQDPGRYFNLIPGTQIVPIVDLQSAKTDAENMQGGSNAPARLQAAGEGILSKRDPITVSDNGDGTYTIIDGNGTYTAAKRMGWTSLPVLVSNEDHTLYDEENVPRFSAKGLSQRADSSPVTSEAIMQERVTALEEISQLLHGKTFSDTLDYLAKIQRLSAYLGGKASDGIRRGAPSDKSTAQDASRDAKFFRDFLNSNAFLEHGFSGLDVETQGVVYEHMLRAAADSKVLDPVVSLVLVDMVNNFAGEQFAAKMTLDNLPVKQRRIPVEFQPDISLGINTADSLVRMMAFVRAVESTSLTLPDLVGQLIDSGAAKVTTDVRHLLTSIEKISNGILDGITSQTDSPKYSVKPSAIPEETRYEKAKRLYQNKYNRMETLQKYAADSGVNISERANVSRSLYVFSGKIADQLQRFKEGKVDPLFEEAAKLKIDSDDIETYLLAQHAAEANAAVQALHKDPAKTAFGMSTADAARILAQFRAMPNFADIKRLADKFQAFTTETADMYYRAGIITKEMRDAWSTAYQHYIPLRGGETTQGTGKGVRVNGKMKRRFGHEMREEFVLENIIKMREVAIKTIEKNNVGLSILSFLKEADDPDIGTIGKPEKRAMVREAKVFAVYKDGSFAAAFRSKAEAELFLERDSNATGATKDRYAMSQTNDTSVVWSASPQLGDHEVNVYIDGHQTRMQITDDIAAAALTNLGAEGLGRLLTVGKEVNNWFSRAYTGYDPRFTIRNTIRDFTAGMVNLTGDYGLKTAGKIALNYPRALKAFWQGRHDPAMNRWIDRYRAHGGSTGASYLSSMERLGGELENMYHKQLGAIDTYRKVYAKERAAGASHGKAYMKAMAKSGLAVFHKIPVLKQFLAMVETMNAISENAFRVSTFMTLVESGKSESEAGEAAKNSTINFDKRGELGAQMGALWLFFNPAVQGMERTFHALFQSKHKRQAQLLVGAMGLVGYIAAELARGGDDDDWDKVPRSIKNRNLVIMTGGGDYIAIPLPYEYGSFVGLGYALNDMAHGKFNKKAAINLAASILDGMMPLGNPVTEEGMSWKSTAQILPTVPKMLLAPGLNQNSFGSAIAPEKYGREIMNSQNMFRATRGGGYDWVAGKMNELTGGTKYRPGVLDVSPEVLKYYTRSILGGAWTFTDQVVDAGRIWVGDGEVERNNVPMKNVLFKELTIKDTAGQYYDLKREADAAVTEWNNAKKDRNFKAASEIREENKTLIRIARISDNQAKMIKSIRDKMDVIRLNDNLSVKDKQAGIKKLENDLEKQYNRLLDAFSRND